MREALAEHVCARIHCKFFNLQEWFVDSGLVVLQIVCSQRDTWLRTFYSIRVTPRQHPPAPVILRSKRIFINLSILGPFDKLFSFASIVIGSNFWLS